MFEIDIISIIEEIYYSLLNYEVTTVHIYLDYMWSFQDTIHPLERMESHHNLYTRKYNTHLHYIQHH